VNVPPAELIKSFIERAFKSPFAQTELLLALKPKLDAAVARIDALLGGAEKGTAYESARLRARAADDTFDASNRFVVLLLEALALHPDEALRAAAKYLLALLFPTRLTVITLSYELEAASGVTFAKRLAQPQAQAAAQTLAAEVPKLGEHLQAIVTAASELGLALEGFDQVLVDKAGKPVDPELFNARTDAQRLFARFVDMVEDFAYPDDTAAHRQARAALIGPYQRFLTANITHDQPVPEATTAPAPTAPTT